LTDRVNEMKVSDVWDKSVSFKFTTGQHLERELLQQMQNFAPDVVFTQSLWAAATIRIANSIGVPTLSFVRSFWRPDRLHATAAENPTWFVANSPAIARYIRKNVGRESLMLYPLIDPDAFRFDPIHATPALISMVNPVPEKGGRLFDQVAQCMPERRFHAVRGWTFKHGAGPRYVEFRSPNIVTTGPHHDMRAVYAQTRLLLVPSLWQEAFGRVVVEAMINGIPVIASDRGALPWVVGTGGSVLTTREPEDWAEEIAAYDDPAYYALAAGRARERAGYFDMNRQLESFAAVVTDVVSSKVRM
jgi:glycosyltransferase involved in cell wall biosynthesis